MQTTVVRDDANSDPVLRTGATKLQTTISDLRNHRQPIPRIRVIQPMDVKTLLYLSQSPGIMRMHQRPVRMR